MADDIHSINHSLQIGMASLQTWLNSLQTGINGLHGLKRVIYCLQTRSLQLALKLNWKLLSICKCSQAVTKAIRLYSKLPGNSNN